VLRPGEYYRVTPAKGKIVMLRIELKDEEVSAALARIATAGGA
jgi:hypothetical protein